MEQNKTHTRLFSLEEDFMNYKTNDLLYGFLRSLSTARPIYEEGKLVKWQEYLPIKTFKQNKKLIAGICGTTTRTIDNHINKLFEVGLLDEGVEIVEKINKDGTVKQYEYECFWFPHNENNKYKIIDKEVVSYLVYTRNAHAIRIYLYLLNKFQWKKGYIFTIQEIKEALGYAESTKSCDALIKDCLASFKAEGLIKFEIIEMPIEESEYLQAKTYRMRLDYVCNSVSELPNRIFK